VLGDHLRATPRRNREVVSTAKLRSPLVAK